MLFAIMMALDAMIFCFPLSLLTVIPLWRALYHNWGQKANVKMKNCRLKFERTFCFVENYVIIGISQYSWKLWGIEGEFRYDEKRTQNIAGKD